MWVIKYSKTEKNVMVAMTDRVMDGPSPLYILLVGKVIFRSGKGSFSWFDCTRRILETISLWINDLTVSIGNTLIQEKTPETAPAIATEVGPHGMEVPWI